MALALVAGFGVFRACLHPFSFVSFRSCAAVVSAMDCLLAASTSVCAKPREKGKLMKECCAAAHLERRRLRCSKL